MSKPFRGRARACGAAFVLLAACADDVPLAPGDQGSPAGDPAVALGFYGSSGAPTGPVGRPCTAPEYRQFDFWIGDWDTFEIEELNGPSIARAWITPIVDGCALHERYDDLQRRTWVVQAGTAVSRRVRRGRRSSPPRCPS